MGLLGTVLWGVLAIATCVGAFFLILAFLGRAVCNLPDSWPKTLAETGLHLAAIIVPGVMLFFLLNGGPERLVWDSQRPIPLLVWYLLLLSSSLTFWGYTLQGLTRRVRGALEIEGLSVRSRPIECPDDLPWVPLPRWNDMHHLNFTEIEIGYPRLHPDLKGMKIGHLTDFHIGKYCPKSFVRKAVDRVLEAEPDLIAITGDFVNFARYLDESFEALQGIQAPLGVFAVRGNHDFWVDPDAIAKGIEELGFELLHDRTLEIKRGGGAFLVSGIESPWNRAGVPLDFIPEESDRFKLVLSHTPDEFPRLLARNPDLVLSGHTHGGQICIPFYGPVLVPSYYGRRYASGIFKERQSILYVSKGIGCYPPLRTLCEPEATIIRLEK